MTGVLRLLRVTSAACAACLFATAAGAATTTVSVPGIADIWLAGHPAGTILNGGFPGSDVAPLNSPVLGSSGLALTPGTSLTVVASGFSEGALLLALAGAYWLRRRE